MSWCPGDYKWNTADLILQGKKIKWRLEMSPSFLKSVMGWLALWLGELGKKKKNTGQVEIISLCMTCHILLGALAKVSHDSSWQKRKRFCEDEFSSSVSKKIAIPARTSWSAFQCLDLFPHLCSGELVFFFWESIPTTPQRAVSQILHVSHYSVPSLCPTIHSHTPRFPPFPQ